MLIVLAAMIAVSQPQPEPSTVPAAGPADQAIIVRGRQVTRGDIATAVADIGRSQASGGFVSQYARWTEPVCVSVAGLPRDGGQLVADKVGSLAREVGLGARGPGCAPNVFIVVTPDPEAMIRQMAARSPKLVYGVPSSVLREIVDSQDAVRWITSTIVKSAKDDPIQSNALGVAGRGLAVLPQWGSSKIIASSKIVTTRITIVVDAKQLGGISYAQLSGYLGLATLSQSKVTTRKPPVDTLLTLFAPGETPPEDLTEFDMAYLRALYVTNQTLSADLQRMDIVNTVRLALAGGTKKP